MKPTLDIEYQRSHHLVSAYKNHYGGSVYILTNPVLIHIINRISAVQTSALEISESIRWAYRLMLYEAIPLVAPIAPTNIRSRMSAYTPKGVFQSIMLDDAQKFITVATARAGLIPSQVCFEELQSLLGYDQVRQDHFFCERIVGTHDKVKGTTIIGQKIGGSIQNQIIFIPDPMGATGSTLSAIIQYYENANIGKPACYIALNMIVAPEYIKNILSKHPKTIIVAGRLDRGLSNDDCLNKAFGLNTKGERGLTSNHYIVPGAGGVGELLNNTEK